MPTAAGDRRRQQAGRERDARAEEDARQEIAAEVVGAEPVSARRRRAAMREVQRVGRVRGDERREDGAREEQGEHDRRPPPVHAVTRGSMAAFTRSAMKFKTTTADEVSMRSAMSTA